MASTASPASHLLMNVNGHAKIATGLGSQSFQAIQVRINFCGIFYQGIYFKAAFQAVQGRFDFPHPFKNLGHGRKIVGDTP